jgi:predicted XRE-type DNA-binding protein
MENEAQDKKTVFQRVGRIENTPVEAENMKFRSALMMALKAHLVRTGLNQTDAAKLFGVTQPRISDLIRGKIDLFDLDALVNMTAAASMHIERRVHETPSIVQCGLRGA